MPHLILKKALTFFSLLVISNFANSNSTINAAGGSTIYLRESAGDVQYSLDNINWNAGVSFPITINSTTPGNVQLNFGSGTYSNTNATQYIINGISGSNQLNISYISPGLPFNNPNLSQIGTFSNSANLSSTVVGLYAISNYGTINTINNDINNTISSSNDYGIVNGNSGSITTLNNSGTISSRNGAISNVGLITTINNTGTIQSTADSAILNSGTITTINNTGSISGTGTDIWNFPSSIITTLNNQQGNLTYRGPLSNNYNIIINSTSDFGKISFTVESEISGFTTFGISSLTGTNIGAAGTRYQNVISGLNGSFINNEATTLTYTNGQVSATYQLLPDDGSVAGTWDLSILSFTSGPSLANTQSSIQRQASSLRGVHNIASFISHYPNSATYDCNLFDVKGMCISAGGRYSTVDNPSSNSSAAVVTLGYKVSPSIRIGGFLDQSVNNNSPTGIDISNKHPMMGAFAYWNQNADGLGYQVKIANAYQDKDLTTTRDVIGTSEAGRGTTSLNSRSYVGELSYAFMFKENTLVRPYFALRYTTIEQDAYTERGVTTPLTYSAINNRTTSALMGVKFKHALTPKTNLIGSLGVEQDLHHKTDRLTAAGIAGLTSENLSGDLHRTRPVASIGATYDIAKSQRLSGEVLVQQLPFQSTAGATAYVNYMIGF
jgi:hypothetical protein